MKKTMYITGGSKGIGYGIAEILLKNDYAVAISGRNQKDIDEAVETLSKISPDVLGITSNVRNFEDEKNAVSKIKEKFGSLDGVIANAGLGIFKSVDELELEDWNAMIETNLTGLFHTLKASMEELKNLKVIILLFLV